MSQIAPTVVTCPRCGATEAATLYTSLNADKIPHEVDAILAGTFERRACASCAHEFQPEHDLLFAGYTRRLWVVMLPLADRPRFAQLEVDVAASMAREFASSPPAVSIGLEGVRARLVFGQHMLAEAVRANVSGVDPVLLECAKLLTIRRRLAELMPFGPFELCFEGFADAGAPTCGVRALPSGERLGDIVLQADVLAEARASQAELRARFPALFERPYLSATRYLIGAEL